MTGARLLLVHAKELVLVDPNFSPNEPRFRDPLVKFLSPPGRAALWQRCELHTGSAELAGNQTTRAHNFARYLKATLPSGASLTVHFWQRRPDGEKLHARYLLTELGGLKFDYGLDTGEPGETTVVALLEHSLWEQLRRDYCSGSTTFLAAPNSPLLVTG